MIEDLLGYGERILKARSSYKEEKSLKVFRTNTTISALNKCSEEIGSNYHWFRRKDLSS